MKQFIVIALSLGGLGNKIFNAGETVNEHNFPEGQAESLVHQGFLKPLSEAEISKRQKEADKKATEQRAEQEKLEKQREAEEKAEREKLEKLRADQELAEKEAADKKAKEEEDARILAEMEKEEADKKAEAAKNTETK